MNKSKISDRIREEASAYQVWIGSLNKKGFPVNRNGTVMNCIQLFDYWLKCNERGIYLAHVRKLINQVKL